MSRLICMLRRFGPILTVAFAVGSSAPAHAQDAESVTIRQLREELAKRDAVIVDLLNRVRALEGQSARSGAAAAEIAARGAPFSPGAAAREVDPSAEGDFEIDALQAERALERGLVQEGARLLAPGQIEFAPAFALSRHAGMFPIALMTDGDSIVGEVERTYDVFERRADLRVGLPWGSQLEIGLPYLTVDQQTATGIDGAVRSAIEQSGSGAGDIAIGFSKVLAAEKSRRPNLIGRLVWLTGSGDERDGAVPLGGGHSGLATRLSAYWRRDPVVFLMSGGYVHFDDDPILEPSDRFDLSLGLGLAVSPETALVFSLNQTFAGELAQAGIELPGTDRLASTLELAVSTILARRLLLRANTGAGLTDDAPDYRFEVSLSSRFDAR